MEERTKGAYLEIIVQAQKMSYLYIPEQDSSR